MGRHAGIYGSGQAGALLLGLVSLAVLTRFLEPAQFGEYALYYVLAALLAVIYTLGWVRGTLIWVFGGRGGDEDDEDDDDEPGDGPLDAETTAADKRSALGTGVVFVLLLAGVGTAIVAATASGVAELVAGEGAEGNLALLAALAGATGGVWTLTTAVARRERRPNTFVVVNLSRPLLILAVTVPLVAVEPTVDSAVLGLAIGSAAAALAGLVAIRNSFTLALKGPDVRKIVGFGLRYAPLILSLFVIANGSVLLLGQFESESEVGIFRVAAGVAALALLPVGAFVTAWGPLRREPIYAAVKAERGKQAASGLLASYFVLAAIWILLVLAVGADLLVMVAPGSYADAAPLIPLVGLGLLLYGFVRVTRRSASFPRKRDWYIGLAVIAAVLFIGVSLALIPPLGTYGAALAGVAAFLFVALAMLARSQLGAEPIPFAHRRIAAGLVIAGACFAVATLVGDAAGALEPVLRIAVILAYPLILVGTGIIPRAHVRPLRRVAKAAVPRRSQGANGRVDLDGLDDVHRAVLEVLVRHGHPVGDVAPLVGVPSSTLEATFIEALRTVAGVDAASPADPRLGAYLLSSAPVASRDQVWRRLSAEGADALEVDALILALERLRRAPDKAWQAR